MIEVSTEMRNAEDTATREGVQTTLKRKPTQLQRVCKGRL